VFPKLRDALDTDHLERLGRACRSAKDHAPPPPPPPPPPAPPPPHDSG
jgi:hypothetical protein